MRNKNYILTWAKKLKLITLLGNKCENCGRIDIFTLEFHHKNNKDNGISRIKDLRFSRLKKEAEKCILLCKNCHAELHYNDGGTDRRRSILKDKMLEYKGITACEECGYSGKSHRSLEFHHRDPSDKAFNIFSEVWKVKKIKNGTIEDKIFRELDKCIVLCRNCHGKRHTDIKRFNKLKDDIIKKSTSYKETTKIDKDQVISLYNSGLSGTQIAKQLGCAKSSISYILNQHK